MSAWVGTDYLFADGDVPDPPPFNPVLGRPDKALVPRWPEPDSPRIHRHFRGYWDPDRSPLFCRVFGRLCWGNNEPIAQGGHDHRRYFAIDLEVVQEHRLHGFILQGAPNEPEIKLTMDWKPFVADVNGPATSYTWNFIIPGNFNITKVRHAVAHQWNGPVGGEPTWHDVAPISAWDLGPFSAWRWAWIDWVAMATNYGGLPPFVPREEDFVFKVFSLAAATSMPSGSLVTINWAAPLREEGGTWWNSGAPTLFTVPAGISQVKIYTQLQHPNSTGYNSVGHLINGAIFNGRGFQSDRSSTGSAQSTIMNCFSAWVDVTPGMQISVQAQTFTPGGSLQLGTACWNEILAR